jgi:hypothetical protein
MSKLNQKEQEQILDFYFRCGSQEDVDRGRDLIAQNPEAAKLYAGLESSLTDLDHAKYEPCPDNLVDLTIARLKLAASGPTMNKSKLHELLEKEQEVEPAVSTDTVPSTGVSSAVKFKHNFLRPAFEVLATAAGIAIVAGILFPSLGLWRQHSQKMLCQNNMRQVGAAFGTFAKDNNERLAAATVKPGSLWWKIGDQGEEIQSNTRYPWQLVKQGYVSGDAFTCKGHCEAEAVQYDQAKMGDLNDFPSYRNISYSFTLLCDKGATSIQKNSRKIIASDLNPIFQKIRCEQSALQKMGEFERIMLNEQLQEMMSSNHMNKGQNLLYCDGSVEYTTVRIINGDDIYTLNGVSVYTGKETPTNPNDVFLAP